MSRKGTKNNVFNAIDLAQGDGAKEAAYQAERQFMEGDFSQAELNEALGINPGDFEEMAYKDDDGYWRVTGDVHNRKWDTWEEMAVAMGIEF